MWWTVKQASVRRVERVPTRVYNTKYSHLYSLISVSLNADLFGQALLINIKFRTEVEDLACRSPANLHGDLHTRSRFHDYLRRLHTATVIEIEFLLFCAL
jgi:hypothetical protein